MSWNRRLLGLLLVGSAAAGLSACDGPGSDWPKGSADSTEVPATGPAGPGESSRDKQDAGVPDAGQADAGVGAPACRRGDAAAADAGAGGLRSNDAGSPITPDASCL